MADSVTTVTGEHSQRPPTPRWSSAAVASIILSLVTVPIPVGPFFFLVAGWIYDATWAQAVVLAMLAAAPSTLGIVFGVKALRDTRTDPDLRGRGLAVGGMILGAVGLIFLAAVGIGVAISSTTDTENSSVSVDDPVGTLRIEELAVALATEPDLETARIVGRVWRIEGVSTRFSPPSSVDLPYGGKLRFEGITSPASDSIGLGNDEEGASNMLFLEFIDAEEESEFNASNGGPIACRIREAKGPPIKGANVFTGGYTLNARWILADSCRAVEPEATQR